jgi:LPXTG-motif cell wall-anchored protein
MRTVQRLGAIAVAAVVAGGVLALPAAAQQTKPVETRPESFIATAAARGLDLNVFGTHVTIGQSSAIVNSEPSAKASGAGVALASGTVSNSEVHGANQSASPPKACVLNLPVANLLTVNLACGESRVDTNGGAPSAFGSGSVAAVDLGGIPLLQPVIDLLQSLLNAILPVLDQTVGTVVNALGPTLGSVLTPLAGNLGLGSNSTVAPVSGLVTSLLDGIKKATGLLTVKLGDSTAQAVTAANLVTATANAAGAQIDLLPGLAAGGAPLLSIIVGSAKSTSTFDRGTAKSTPSFDAAVARVRLGLPLLGSTITEIPIAFNTPITLLAGTPLESTISLGAGRTVTDPDTGAVASYADGVSVQLLKGVSGGIGLELAHAETGAGGKTRLVSQQEIVQPVPSLAKTGNDPWLPLAGGGMLLGALVIRRRLVAARPARSPQRVSR